MGSMGLIETPCDELQCSARHLNKETTPVILLAHADDGRPVPLVLVLERGGAAPLAHEHVRREEALLDAVWVEADLVARARVNEGEDHLEEGVHEVECGGQLVPAPMGVEEVEDVHDYDWV